ncbi:class I adenylate-forming enzyme family protein [Micromonospora musae]|uniref:class I adenylate-forming enzyme family protein n=1 Tax=Micromonospora musae TaxID=1894970 RepID=UPI0018F5A2BE|nr:AMP-binding protein [Micromonospora musae]
MTAERAALRCGATVLTDAQLRDRIAAAGPAGVDVPGRVVPILDDDRVAALTTALAVRAAGGVPLIGDDRWNGDYWAGLRATVAAADPAPGMAWATFSSGSTGTPRVIVRTDESWSASYPGVERLLDLTADDVVYLPSPLVSSVTMFSVVHARTVGASVLLPRTHTVSDSDLEHATVLHGTPYALRSVLERIEAGTAHRLRVALVGGARLDAGLRSRSEAAGIRLIAYYGAAELSFVAVDPDGRGLRPFDGVETRVDEGLLWVRSPYFAAGYLGTASGPFRRDPEGWGTVGDLVGGDPADPLRFRGRRDGAILTAAATVIPEDVEAALQRLDGIEDVVVFGLPNPRAGALVAAVIETGPGGRPPSARELRRRAGALLSGTHLPRRWFWTERLPRTATGKPARDRIRHDAIEGTVSRVV